MTLTIVQQMLVMMLLHKEVLYHLLGATRATIFLLLLPGCRRSQRFERWWNQHLSFAVSTQQVLLLLRLCRFVDGCSFATDKLLKNHPFLLLCCSRRHSCSGVVFTIDHLVVQVFHRDNWLRSGRILAQFITIAGSLLFLVF